MGDKQQHYPVKAASPGCVKQKVKVTFGASTAIASSSPSVVAVAKAATGRVSFTFPVPYQSLSGISMVREGAAGTAHLLPLVTTNNIATTGAVNVSLTSEAGTETDPTSGDSYYFEFTLDEVGLV